MLTKLALLLCLLGLVAMPNPAEAIRLPQTLPRKCTGEPCGIAGCFDGGACVCTEFGRWTCRKPRMGQKPAGDE
ncbi:unnamed protein product, partial [Mesorhabditis spiculigera]